MAKSLRKYQEEDVYLWISRNFRGAWFWDPGLGKTHSASFLCGRLLKKAMARKIFIGGPAAAISTWYNFLTGQGGFSPAEIFNHSIPEQEEAGYNGEKIILCNYEKLPPPPERKRKTVKVVMSFDEAGNIRLDSKKINNTRKIRKFPADIDLWILDESQYLKEHDSVAFLFFKRSIKPGDKVLLMSGTPFPNRLVSCYAQMSLLVPGIVGKNISEFRVTYCEEINKQYQIWRVRSDMTAALESKIKALCSFRSSEVYLQLPPVTFSELVYRTTPEQEKVISGLYKKGEIVDGEGNTVLLRSVNTGHMMAQQLLSGYIDMTVKPQTSDLDKVRVKREFDSPDKFRILCEFLGMMKGRKVIVWVNFTETSDRLKKDLTEAGYKVERFNGSDKKDLDGRIRRFLDGDCEVLLSHPQVIGISRNEFVEVQYMVWYELTWNWAVYEQAVTRIYRSGQRLPTFCYHMIAHRIEQRQLKALQEKEDVHDSLSKEVL